MDAQLARDIAFTNSDGRRTVRVETTAGKTIIFRLDRPGRGNVRLDAARQHLIWDDPGSSEISQPRTHSNLALKDIKKIEVGISGRFVCQWERDARGLVRTPHWI